MKKIHYTLLAGLALLLAGFHACDTQLSPIDVIPESRAFESAKDVYGAYRIAFRNTPSLIGTTSYTTDNVRMPSTNSGRGVSTYQWAYDSDRSVGGWGSLYGGIDEINRALAGAQRLLDKAAATSAQLDSIRGQLYGLRAYYYWALLNRFSNPQKPDSPGVPIKTEAHIDIYEKPARAPVKAVLKRIASDIDSAGALMQEGGPLNLFNKDALRGLKARIALGTGAFSQAAAQAGELIDQYPLATGKDFEKVWTDEANTGVIMKKSMVKADGASKVGTSWAFVDGTLLWNPASGLLSLYAEDDIRKTTYFKIDPTDPEKNQIVKYPGRSSKDPLRNDIKLMRVAEMYFIRAEAYAQLGQLGEAAADINAIRKARLTAYTPLDLGANKTEAIKKILESKRKEMCFEGVRWYDLKRNHLPITRADADCKRGKAGTGPDICTLPADDPRWLLPIPSAEIFANPNATQNPGY